MKYILKEYLKKHTYLSDFSIEDTINSRAVNKIALIIPNEIINNYKYETKQMIIRTPANIDVSCEIEKLFAVLRTLKYSFTKFKYDSVEYIINFNFDEANFNSYENNKKLYSLEYKIKITRR